MNLRQTDFGNKVEETTEYLVLTHLNIQLNAKQIDIALVIPSNLVELLSQ